MNSSKDHKNWITIGGIIKLVSTPVACYADHVLKSWHIKLCRDCLAHGSCSNPVDCQTKNKCSDLCPSCKGWYDELASSHRNGKKSQIRWRQNCDTSKWSSDHWEVAKFFMSTLGDNKSSVQDAKSTDLSSLLNVLEWMKAVAFGAERRVDINSVIKLRSDVRNAWAHAPNQEMTDDQLKNAFAITDQFLSDLDAIFNHQEVKTCIKEIQSLRTDGLTNVVEAELNNLLLLRNELGGDVSKMKEDIKKLKQDQNSDRQILEESERKLRDLDDLTTECCKRMEDLQKWKHDLDKLFGNFHLQIESFRDETRKNFSEIHAAIKKLQPVMKVQENKCSEARSYIPEKLSAFTGRKREVHDTVSFLVEKNCGIVSVVGGPGFGKSTIAIEVSHCCSQRHGIPVNFSYLSNVSSKDEVIRRLCHDLCGNPGEDPESSLMLWLKNLKRETILVMDNIEQFLEGETRFQFTDLLRMLRKNSNQHLKVLTTSRNHFEVGDLKVENVEVGEMDDVSSVELLKKFCPGNSIDDKILHYLAKLCGHIPLALSIAASRIQDTDDPKDLLEWLAEKPMEALQSSKSDLCVQRAIEMSFSRLSDEDQKAFVRLGVFNGDFDRNAAQNILESKKQPTHDLLEKLANRSLMQRSGSLYQIHLLVKRFLANSDQLRDEWSIAQRLMVKYFLEVCQSWTEEYYSKDGCNSAKKSLAKEAHHVEEMIKVCQSLRTHVKPGIVVSLESSSVYQTSSRFFYNFIRSVLPPSTVRNFLECCVEQAKRRGHLAIEINFQCLLTDEEGHKCDWKSDEYMKRMEEVKETFDKNEHILVGDNAVVSHFYYCYGRYLSNKQRTPSNNRLNLLEQSVHFLELSWSLRDNKELRANPLEKVDEAITLIQLGRSSKELAKVNYKSNAAQYNRYMNHTQELYQRALSLTKELLGDHGLTFTCYKCLGDLFLHWRRNEEALECYEEANNMCKRLELYSNYSVVSLLKSYSLCLFYLSRYEEAVKQLEEARDIADKLVERDSSFRLRAAVYFRLAQAFSYWKPKGQEVKKYAKIAISMKDYLGEKEIKKLEELLT